MTNAYGGTFVRGRLALGLLVVGAAALAAVALNCGPRGGHGEARWPEELLGPKPGLLSHARKADNAECFVCHADFREELISREHADHGIGCYTCHGPSRAHGGDEANIMPPDVVFGRAEIGRFCRSCHASHPTGKEYGAFVAEWTGKRRKNGRLVSADSVCTDCHGNHAVLRPDQLQYVPSE
jgi:hypothetical protein